MKTGWRYFACGWNGKVEVMWECDGCGAAVVDRDAHDEFHKTLRKLVIALGE